MISENSELPRDENPVFNYNPIKEKLLVELTKVKMQNILDNQNFAPTLTMGVSFSESTKTKKDGVNYIEDKNSFDWSFSLGINFSNFLSSKNRLRKEQYENNLEIYQEQLKELEKQGYYEFTVGVEDDNIRARYIYKKYGFNTVISRQKESYQGDSYEYDLLLKQ